MSKLGKKNYIGVDEMWELFLQYQEWAKATPVEVQDYVGKDGKEVHRKRERPLTLVGFELFVYNIKNCVIAQYFYGGSGDYTDYKNVAERIRKTIQNDQIVGGMTNIYNPSITARLNGLKESVEESGSKELTIKVKYERKGSSDNT
jgi:hypothetical protein